MTTKRQQKKIAKGMTIYLHEKDFGLGQHTFPYSTNEFNIDIMLRQSVYWVRESELFFRWVNSPLN
jgi:hypothetical protein